MFNLMKADLQRILRGKGIWITGIILLILILPLTMGHLGENVGTIGMYQMQDELAAVGIHMPHLMMGAVDNLSLFIIPLISFVLMTDFGTQVIKNTVGVHFTRSKYLFSKILTVSTLAIVFHLLYIGIPTIIVTIVAGFGGTIGDFFSFNGLAILGQLLFMVALSLMGIFLGVLFKNTTIMVSLYMVITLAPIMIIFILADVFGEGLLRLMDFTILENMSLMLQLDTIGQTDIIRAIGVGAGLLIISLFGSLMVFKKAEIK